VKGQGWLYDAMHLGGLYYDGNSAERSTQQRIRRMTENLPETNGTLAVFDVHGRGLNYVEELPFFDSMYAKAVFPLCFIRKMAFCQDRLGTNVGKALKTRRTPFSQVDVRRYRFHTRARLLAHLDCVHPFRHVRRDARARHLHSRAGDVRDGQG
jgi:hypothetical protein